jgi:IS5 family transposase
MRGSPKKFKALVGRVWRDIERQLDKAPETLKQQGCDLLAKVERLLTRQRHVKNKRYSLHAQEVEYIN